MDNYYKPKENRTFFTEDGTFEFVTESIYSLEEIKRHLKEIGFFITDLNEQVLKHFEVIN